MHVELNTLLSRPRFLVYTRKDTAMIMALLKEQLALHPELTGYATTQIATIKVKEGQKHYWSPQLHLQYQPVEGNITAIRGVYGPSVPVWSFFMFLYTIGTTTFFLLGMYGMVQRSLNMDAPFLWAMPLGLTIVGATYLATRIGQRLAKAHLSLLHEFVENTFDPILQEQVVPENEPGYFA